MVQEKAKVIEIFSSIQGEGKYVGVKQVFVRFFECNMHCVWCDTPHSIGDTTRHYKELSWEEINQKITELWQDSHSVSLTGGEPLVQADFLKTLLPSLRQAGRPAHLETNGVLPHQLLKVIDDVDAIAMDIKLPSSTKCQPFWEEHEAFLRIALRKEVFVKTVISSDTQKADIERTVDLLSSVDAGILCILQPNTYDLGDGVIKKCLEYQAFCLRFLKNVRVLPQVHKFMKIR